MGPSSSRLVSYVLMFSTMIVESATPPGGGAGDRDSPRRVPTEVCRLSRRVKRVP